jgi:hypothetical protein
MTIESIVFYILLIDAIAANVLALFGADWYAQNFGGLSRWFPLAQGWALYYLALVLWVGSLLYRSGRLF